MTEIYTQIVIPKGEWEKSINYTFAQTGIPVIFNGRELSTRIPGLPHRSR